jgi:Fe-S-cluster containining protein
MKPEQKKKQLFSLYNEFEQAAAIYKQDAVCSSGCAYCCTHFGTLDITTLEGFFIWQWVQNVNFPVRSKLKDKIQHNRHEKENNRPCVCPFLKEDKTCMIYALRPFSCRQLYSLKKCGEHGPLVHPQAVHLARQTIAKLQRLDKNGYSGHLTYILALFDMDHFRRLYLAGGCDPGKIYEYGKSHQLQINHTLPGPASSTA